LLAAPDSNCEWGSSEAKKKKTTKQKTKGNMRVQHAVAVAFVCSLLGNDAAQKWDNKKLSDRLKQIPDRIDREKVKEEFHGLYDQLNKLKDDESVTIEGQAEAPTSAPDSKPEKSDKGAKGSKPSSKGSSKPASKGGKSATKDKKKEKEKKPAPEKDKFGFRVGSSLSKIAASLTDKGQTDEEIAKSTGLPVKKVRGRLRRLKRQKVANAERRVEYSLAKK
jgi:hypothetical protein